MQKVRIHVVLCSSLIEVLAYAVLFTLFANMITVFMFDVRKAVREDIAVIMGNRIANTAFQCLENDFDQSPVGINKLSDSGFSLVFSDGRRVVYDIQSGKMVRKEGRTPAFSRTFSGGGQFEFSLLPDKHNTVEVRWRKNELKRRRIYAIQ
jgi:hypothetical protein